MGIPGQSVAPTCCNSGVYRTGLHGLKKEALTNNTVFTFARSEKRTFTHCGQGPYDVTASRSHQKRFSPFYQHLCKAVWTLAFLGSVLWRTATSAACAAGWYHWDTDKTSQLLLKLSTASSAGWPQVASGCTHLASVTVSRHRG